MSMRTLTVNVSREMYEALARRAANARSTVADELVRAAKRDVSAEEQLPPELEAELAALVQADDPTLWSIARRRYAQEQARRLEELHHLSSSAPLSSSEEDEADSLIAEQDRYMLLRAQAAALLKSRGHDVSSLFLP